MSPGVVAAELPLLVVLKETGQVRNGLPVYTVDAAAEPVQEALARGLSGRLLRLYRCEQTYLAGFGGPEPEPAYLLRSHNQGGFPRFGFFLDDEEKRQAGYVDLQIGMPVVGRFGALDQIFPHELAHVIVQQLAGEPAAGGSNQIHAIGVTTDRVLAYQEGFAEHFQILAIDDLDADPRTASLSGDEQSWIRSRKRLGDYARAMSARLHPACRPRMTFPLWFSRAEHVMRYRAVKANAFAFETPIAPRLLAGHDPWPAYLLQNIVPGDPAGTAKTVERALACEGVVSNFFWRWACSPGIRAVYRDDAFYARFGRVRSNVDSLDNVYLKLFDVLHEHRPQDTATLIAAYREACPEETAALDSVVRSTFSTTSLPAEPPLWLVNRSFTVGTSVFDQFRRARRSHVFDLNAASLLDLMAIPGMNRPLAERILAHTPLTRVGGLEQVQGMTPDLLGRFRTMAAREVRERAAESEKAAVLQLRAILMAYVWHALAFIAAAAAGGAILYRRVRRGGWIRSILAGLCAAFVGLVAAWLMDSPSLPTAIVAPTLLGGVPAASWSLLRRRSPPEAGRALAGWAVAAVPAAILVQPWL